ncbi:alanine racemase [Pueribacillus sp. YX66]|uniref:alanine racemase n=1 Tax=Pueribacillus sp. YX66 TaxID=3229242 RepID=UPI00358D597E
METQPFYRDTWAEVDLDAIRENVTAFRHHLHKETKVMAVVKANAYGHGAVEVASVALEAGADYLAVALLDEAIQLRMAGITAPILVMGWVRPSDASLAEKYNVALTFFQKEWLEKVLETNITKLNLHLKFDTGMSRLGLRNKREAEAILDILNKHKSLKLEGVYTHFATADDMNSQFFHTQQERFRHWLTWLRERGVYPSAIHISNSAGATRLPNDSYSFIRLGISMYGLKPSDDIDPPFELKPAFSLHSQLVHVKELMPGDTISYGATYTVKEREWIGTVPIGYADGWIRRLATEGRVLIKGEYAPIVGRICMDQCMVRLPKKLPIGTKVTLIGEQGSNKITIDEIATKLETINYEIPCNLTARIPRVYMENKQKVSVRNLILNSFKILEGS